MGFVWLIGSFVWFWVVLGKSMEKIADFSYPE
jgi:hypothetical protein